MNTEDNDCIVNAIIFTVCLFSSFQAVSKQEENHSDSFANYDPSG